jgi:hypothetical protein
LILFLQIVGGIVLSLIIIVVLLFLLLRSKFRRFLKKVAEDEASQIPFEIHLNEDLAPDWLRDEAATNELSALAQAGFEKGTPYTIHEMPDVGIIPLFNQDLIAVVYMHEKVGVFTDLFYKRSDGFMITVSSSPFAGDFKSHPNTKILARKGAAASILLDAMSKEKGEESGVLITPKEFRAFYESYYRDDICWKNNQGGTSFSEFKNIAKNENHDLDSEQLWDIYIESKTEEIQRWHDFGLTEFEEKFPDIYKLINFDKERLILVPKKVETEAFLHYLESWDFIAESKIEQLIKVTASYKNIPAVFKTLNDCLSVGIQAKQVGDIEFPVSAGVYKIKYNDN